MYLVAGLGNPGVKYQNNRHNAGFLFIDYLINKHNYNPFKKKKNYHYSLNNDIVYIKPTTYMNLSGIAVISAMAFFKILPKNVVVIYDDVALPIGKIRIRERGSDGGHNGLKNIQQMLGTQEYKRMRIGIGAPEYTGQMISHVLGDFTSDDMTLLNNDIFTICEKALNLIIKNNIKQAMNRYNGYSLQKSESQSQQPGE